MKNRKSYVQSCN